MTVGEVDDQPGRRSSPVERGADRLLEAAVGVVVEVAADGHDDVTVGPLGADGQVGHHATGVGRPPWAPRSSAAVRGESAIAAARASSTGPTSSSRRPVGIATEPDPAHEPVEQRRVVDEHGGGQEVDEVPEVVGELVGDVIVSADRRGREPDQLGVTGVQHGLLLAGGAVDGGRVARLLGEPGPLRIGREHRGGRPGVGRPAVGADGPGPAAVLAERGPAGEHGRAGGPAGLDHPARRGQPRGQRAGDGHDVRARAVDVGGELRGGYRGAEELHPPAVAGEHLGEQPRRQAVPLTVEAGDGDRVRAGGRGHRGVPRDGGDHALADVGGHVLLDDRPLPRGPALADLALRRGDHVEQHDLGVDPGVERVDGHRDRAGLVGDGDALEVGDAQGVGGGHAGAWIARSATSSWSCPSSHSTTDCSRCSHTTAAGAPAQAGRAAARRSSPKKSPGPRASTTPSL